MPHHLIATNMNKTKQIIIGILIALVLIIIENNSFTSFSESSTEYLEWSQIFSSKNKGIGLYNNIRRNMFEKPKNQALIDSARKFGLNTFEANQLSSGSVAVLYNNPSKKYRGVDYNQFMDEYNAFMTYYNDLIEIYTLKEEMDAMALPSEIFSNGDLSDSGFDLIEDYKIMQEILFKKSSPIKTGYKFPSSSSSPNIDTVYLDNNFNTEVSSEGSVGSVGSVGSENQIVISDLNDESDLNNLESPEDLVPVSIVESFEEDICVDESLENNFSEIFANYENKVSLEKERLDQSKLDENINDDFSDDEANDQNYQILSEDGDINPAQRSKWGNSFCPNISPSYSKSGSGYAVVAGENGFESLRYFKDSFLDSTLSAGMATVIGGVNTNLKFAICLSTEFVYKTYSSYTPDASCIKCEIDKINEIMNQVLTTSLVPNKVTGNFMESAKCKDAFSLIPSMNIIAVASPISTPMNFDLISEKNIFTEWNNFIAEYRPFLSDFGQVPGDFESDFILENLSENPKLTDTLLEIQVVKNNNFADALLKARSLEVSKELSDKNIYAREFHNQIKQFKNMFISFEKMVEDLVDVCKLVENKDNID